MSMASSGITILRSRRGRFEPNTSRWLEGLRKTNSALPKVRWGCCLASTKRASVHRRSSVSAFSCCSDGKVSVSSGECQVKSDGIQVSALQVRDSRSSTLDYPRLSRVRPARLWTKVQQTTFWVFPTRYDRRRFKDWRIKL